VHDGTAWHFPNRSSWQVQSTPALRHRFDPGQFFWRLASSVVESWAQGLTESKGDPGGCLRGAAVPDVARDTDVEVFAGRIDDAELGVSYGSFY
jgi:hypothetical protein